MTYAVIDTNVLLSSLLTSDKHSATVTVMKAIRCGLITPVFSRYLLEEYEDVLKRDKFGLPINVVRKIIRLFSEHGVLFDPDDEYVVMPDPDDVPIYLIALQTRDAGSYLVTGNTKHFPDVDFVVTPRQMVDLLGLGVHDNDRNRIDYAKS